MGANHLSISREKRVGIIDRSTAPSKKGMEGEAGEEGGGGGWFQSLDETNCGYLRCSFTNSSHGHT